MASSESTRLHEEKPKLCNVNYHESNALLRALYHERRARTVERENHFYIFGRLIRIVEDAGLSIGSRVWESSYCVCKHLEEVGANYQLANKRIIELGSGCGLLGIAAHHLGCKEVVLTDKAEVLPLLRKNVQLNGLDESQGVTVRELDWTKRNVAELNPPFSCILASDVVYYPEHFEPLVATLIALSANGTRLILGYRTRSQEEAKFFHLLSAFFRVDKLYHKSVTIPAGSSFSTGGLATTASVPASKEVVVFVMTRLPHSVLLDMPATLSTTPQQAADERHGVKRKHDSGCAEG